MVKKLRVFMLIACVGLALCSCSLFDKKDDSSKSNNKTENTTEAKSNTTKKDETKKSEAGLKYAQIPIKPYFTGDTPINEFEDHYEVTAPLKWVEYLTKDEADAQAQSKKNEHMAQFTDDAYSYKGVSGYYYFMKDNGKVYGRGNSGETVTICIPKDAVIVDGKNLSKHGVIDDKSEKMKFEDFINNGLKTQWETGWDGVNNAYFVTFDEKTGYVKDIVFVSGFDADKLGA